MNLNKPTYYLADDMNFRVASLLLVFFQALTNFTMATNRKEMSLLASMVISFTTGLKLFGWKETPECYKAKKSEESKLICLFSLFTLIITGDFFIIVLGSAFMKWLLLLYVAVALFSCIQSWRQKGATHKEFAVLCTVFYVLYTIWFPWYYAPLLLLYLLSGWVYYSQSAKRTSCS